MSTEQKTSSPGIQATQGQTAETAKVELNKKGVRVGNPTSTKKKDHKLFIIVLVLGSIVVAFALYFFMKPTTQQVVDTSTEAVTVDNISDNISSSSAPPNVNPQSQQAPLDPSLNFVVDENIVFLDQATGQYMIRYRDTTHVVDSPLGKSAIDYYKSQGIDVLALLARLQEREKNSIDNPFAVSSNNGEGEQGTQSNTDYQKLVSDNDYLKQENQDLRNLVNIQESSIQQLKTSLIQVANEIKNKQSQQVSTHNLNEKINIPKGSKAKEAFAIVGDRAWLDIDGTVIPVTVGDVLPGNITVRAIDASKNKVWIK